MTNATASGNSLEKTSGCDGCQDAGGRSVQTIPSGDGLVTFTLADMVGQHEVGLSSSTSLNTSAINFGLNIAGGIAEVRESGTYKADTRVAVGDTLSIAVSSGVVVYQKNGVTFYRSSKRPTYPLRASAVLLSMDSTASQVMMAAGAGSTSGTGTHTSTGDTVGTAVPTGGSAVAAGAAWTSVKNASVSGDVVTKTSGCDGCQDAGAISSQTISSGDGALSFTVDELSTQRAIGLSTATTENVTAINYGFMLEPGNIVEVREAGVYRADVQAAVGDVFTISIQGGKVTYLKNGTPIYQSTAAVKYPLRANISLMNMSATAAKVMLSGAQ